MARLAQPLGRRYARPGDLAKALDRKTVTSPALEAIDDALISLMEPASPVDALMVFMPPQEGKSQRVSRRFVEWLLDHDPALRIAIVSYGDDLALRWGRDIKMDIAMNPCRNPDGAESCDHDCGGLHIKIRRDSFAAGRWETPEGGGVYCVGIGGPLAGKPVDILIIDDPVKDRQAAESKIIRESTWDWWESVAIPRRGTNSRVVLIQCMTGDTPVLMGDGTEMPLRDIRPGDIVATYDRGRLTTSTVRNWANQGPDFVYRITMKSGRVVRANARHPFLTVKDGVETWQRTDVLKPGSRILRATGGSGAESPARAASPRDAQAATARGYACPATASSAGLTGTARRQSTGSHAAPRTSATATASAWRSMTGYLRSRAASAPSAAGRIVSLPIGSPRSASITAMTPAGCAACSATTATLSSATRQQRQPFAPPLTTYVVEADEVVEVAPCGAEDVFDLQIDRTENFIANGLVSHNTRWHEDDLAGRMMARPSPLNWRVLKIPAIADAPDDPLGRAQGDELPSVRQRPRGFFRNLRANMSPYVFAGVYQQSPTAPEGNFFRRASFRYWRPMEPWPDGRERIWCEAQPVTLVDCWRFITMDFAASTKNTADFTVASAWAVTPAGDLILLDRVRDRVPDHEHFALAAPLQARWGIDQVYVESNWWSKTFVSDARDNGVAVAEVLADTDKVTRAIPAAGRVHAGRVWFPAQAAWLEEWVNELAIFPQGAHDDQVDTLSYAARVVVHEWTPAHEQPRPGLTPWDNAINTAAAAATGDGHEPLDIMNVPY
jgi:predicted phage terminase large subunit-like protein